MYLKRVLQTFGLFAPHCVISRWISAAGNYSSWTTTLGARPDAGEIEKEGQIHKDLKTIAHTRVILGMPNPFSIIRYIYRPSIAFMKIFRFYILWRQDTL